MPRFGRASAPIPCADARPSGSQVAFFDSGRKCTKNDGTLQDWSTHSRSPPPPCPRGTRSRRPRSPAGRCRRLAGVRPGRGMHDRGDPPGVGGLFRDGTARWHVLTPSTGEIDRLNPGFLCTVMVSGICELTVAEQELPSDVDGTPGRNRADPSTATPSTCSWTWRPTPATRPAGWRRGTAASRGCTTWIRPSPWTSRSPTRRPEGPAHVPGPSSQHRRSRTSPPGFFGRPVQKRALQRKEAAGWQPPLESGFR